MANTYNTYLYLTSPSNQILAILPFPLQSTQLGEYTASNYSTGIDTLVNRQLQSLRTLPDLLSSLHLCARHNLPPNRVARSIQQFIVLQTAS